MCSFSSGFALVVFATALSIAANKIDTRINRAGCGESEPVGRVYNGEPTSRESVPWIVQVHPVYTLLGGADCSGSIITRNVILTASHCMFKTGLFPERVFVFLNNTGNGNGPAVQAERMQLHPRFVKNAEYVYDVALLKLPIDLEFNRIMKPVCLPTRDIKIAKKSLLVAGWGSTESANRSEVLLHGRVDGMTDQECKDWLRSRINPITNRRLKLGPIICAKGSYRTACPGDSGGPLTLEDDLGRSTQVGIVSFGVNCSLFYPTAYSRVAFHMRWIKTKLGQPRKWRKLPSDGHLYFPKPVKRT
ncbi:hypothetical protein MTO96_007859 [Rhipicephalus appendiculatus]